MGGGFVCVSVQYCAQAYNEINYYGTRGVFGINLQAAGRF